VPQSRSGHTGYRKNPLTSARGSNLVQSSRVTIYTILFLTIRKSVFCMFEFDTIKGDYFLEQR
jgi:hypothetical protein